MGQWVNFTLQLYYLCFCSGILEMELGGQNGSVKGCRLEDGKGPTATDDT